MIDREHDLPLVRQAELLRLSRSTLYYEPRPVPTAELAVMRRIDELHLEYPFAGSRMLRDLLRGEGIAIGRELVATMRRMRIEALYRRPNTSKPADGHKIYPYLLRSLAVERPNQVWAMDITYIPMARGFVYLAAVVDWFSRRVLAWRLSITLEVEFCLEAVEEALARHGRPEIFNTDKAVSSPAPRSPACCWTMPSRSAWMAAAHGATMSLLSGCGGRSNTRRSTCGPTTVSAMPVLRSAGTWISTIARGHIRASLPKRRIAPTSITCHCSRQPESRRRCRGITPVGLRPPCVTPRQQHTTMSTGRGSTYRGRNAVSTKPATSGGLRGNGSQCQRDTPVPAAAAGRHGGDEADSGRLRR
jgi:putative transposase